MYIDWRNDNKISQIRLYKYWRTYWSFVCVYHWFSSHCIPWNSFS